jgi:hypothetical protein
VRLPDRLRFAVGFACVAAAIGYLVWGVPHEAKQASAAVGFYAYIKTPETRLLTTGDSLDIPYGLQAEALSAIPASADYAVVLPDSQTRAGAVGINPITYETVVPWLRYLLLPAELSSMREARYIVCWECDRAVWNRRVRWLWTAEPGMAIGLRR